VRSEKVLGSGGMFWKWLPIEGSNPLGTPIKSINGTCLIRFDNESGKGDHKHVGSQEESYRFIDVETLVADFLAEIERARRK
jgi:hypothetical protein